MTRFATAEDLATYRAQPVETAQAEVVLDLVSEAVRQRARQIISEVVDDTTQLVVEAGLAILPQLPTTAIGDVTALWVTPNRTLDASEWQWDGGEELWLWPPPARAAYPGLFWPRISVTYTHGYPVAEFAADGRCADLWEVTLSAAKRLFDPVPEASWGWQQTGINSVLFQPEELTAIDRYGKPRVPL